VNVSPWHALLAAAQSGAEWAWERIYRELAPKVRGYLIGRGAQDPDGLVGDVFLQVARNIGTFDGDEGAFRSWVFMIAHHRLIDERRRRTRRPTEPLPADLEEAAYGCDQSAEAAAMVKLATDEILELLDGLTDDQREVLVLRIFGDLTVDQVAEIVGKRPGAVKALQRRGLRALERRLRGGVPL